MFYETLRDAEARRAYMAKSADERMAERVRVIGEAQDSRTRRTGFFAPHAVEQRNSQRIVKEITSGGDPNDLRIDMRDPASAFPMRGTIYLTPIREVPTRPGGQVRMQA